MITPRQPSDIGFHANTLDACGEAGFKPKFNSNGRDFTTIASMIAVGIGIALVPKSMDCFRLPGLRYLPLTDNEVTTDLAIVYRKAKSTRPLGPSSPTTGDLCADEGFVETVLRIKLLSHDEPTTTILTLASGDYEGPSLRFS